MNNVFTKQYKNIERDVATFAHSTLIYLGFFLLYLNLILKIQNLLSYLSSNKRETSNNLRKRKSEQNAQQLCKKWYEQNAAIKYSPSRKHVHIQ